MFESFRDVNACNSTSFKKQARAFMCFKNGTLWVHVRFRLMAEQRVPTAGLEESYMSIGTIILIILVIALLGGFSGIGGGPFYGTGYYGGGGLGLIVVILLVLLLLGRL
jgi:hypothetical protein